MVGPLHRLARLVRLGLACLVLTAAVAPVQAMPSHPAAIALLVARPASPRHGLEAQARQVEARRAGAGVLQPTAPRTRAVAPLPPETRLAGSPRPLFLLHRALLR
jgi:hypothetical protein